MISVLIGILYFILLIAAVVKCVNCTDTAQQQVPNGHAAAVSTLARNVLLKRSPPSPIPSPSPIAPISPALATAPVVFSFSSKVFNGSNSLVVNNFNTSFQWTDFTISVWITATTSQTSVIVTLGRTPTNYNGEFKLSIASQNLDFWDYSYATGYGYSGSGKAVLASGVQYHIAFVKHGLTAKFYVNGQVDNVIYSSSLVKYLNEALCFGADYRDGGSNFNGAMNLLRIYGAALSDSDIAALYTGHTPSSAPRTAAPSNTPSSLPVSSPTFKSPSNAPTTTKTPSSPPVVSPTFQPPSNAPTTIAPTKTPSSLPVVSPTFKPPSNAPTTISPTKTPSSPPVSSPTFKPPSSAPTTLSPSKAPSNPPVVSPTFKPPSNAPVTLSPTKTPSNAPITNAPSASPSTPPVTTPPSRSPTSNAPKNAPTSRPSPFPVRPISGVFNKFAILKDASGANISSSSDNPRVPRLFDWNGDGKLDLLVGSSGYIKLYLNYGSFSSPRFGTGAQLNASDGSAIFSGDSWSTFTLSDMDGDGLQDLVMSDWFKRLTVYKNMGATIPGKASPVFATPYYVVSSVTGADLILPDRRFDVGDWNMDGLPDVVCGAYCGSVYLLLNTNTATSAAYGATQVLMDSQCYNWYPRLYDVNYNGVLDLIRGINWGDITYWLDPVYLGLGSSSQLTLNSVFNSMHTLTNGAIVDFGDLNGDCNVDMVIGGDGGFSNLFITYGLPSASRSCSPTRAPSQAPSSPTVTPTRAPSAPSATPVSAGPTRKPTSKPSNPSGTWKTMTTSFETDFAKLLTDGSVMIIQKQPYKLVPNINGSYLRGTWKALAPIPSDYSPVWFASAVLPDGRVAIAGGEYGVNKTKAVIYDPVRDSWQIIPTPPYCKSIGDSPSLLLADGRWMVGFSWCHGGAILDSKTLSWIQLNYTNKVISSDESYFNLLPDNTVLSVMDNAQIYNPETDSWSPAGSGLPLQKRMVDDAGEIGPSVLRPDGTVFVAGATGVSSIYDTHSKTWSKGPNFPISPSGYICHPQDAPGSLLPNGNVLVACAGGSGGYGTPAGGYQSGPTYWYEFDGTNLNLQNSPPNIDTVPGFYYNMLMLPNGQILQTRSSTITDFYTPAVTTYPDSWRPLITALPAIICRGGVSLKVTGIQLSGMSQGAASLGDDFQADTNFPVVRITNSKTKHVFYCRTHDHSSVAVQSKLSSYTFFDVPTSVELGASVLEVIASGMASLPSPINVVATC